MGCKIIDYYKNYFKKSWKIAFISSIIIGLCVHLYKFTNTLVNHDSVLNYYHTQDLTILGRWFLSIACGFSSYFDLPWITGLFSIILIAFCTMLIIDIFEINNPIIIILCSGMLTVYPSITETFFYQFTADGYMLAMLLSTFSVYLIKIDTKKISRYIISMICICLSCAIYQAYVSFSLVLMLCYFIYELFKGNYANKTYFKYIARQICTYALALILYYIIWKISLNIREIELWNYQGIDNMQLNIIGGIYSTIKSLLAFFFEFNLLEHGLTVYNTLNIIFILLLILTLLITTIKSKIFKEKSRLILLILSLIAIPFAICIWHFTSKTVQYRPMMMGSTCILYILLAVLVEKWCKPSLKNIVGIVIALIIFNNAIQANICYFYMNKCYERTYADTFEMVQKIKEISEGTDATKYAITGNIWTDVSLDTDEYINTKLHLYAPVLTETLAYQNLRASAIIDNTFNLDLDSVTEEEIKVISQSDEIIDMECWPHKDSVKVIGDTVVIKLNEYDPDYQ